MMEIIEVKHERAITLIALIITVVVMLILAGVAISILTSDDGLFEKTRSSAEAYEVASQKEEEQINDLMNSIDIYINELSTKKPVIQSAAISDVVSVGDYVDYDAGIWNATDLAKITNSPGGPTIHGSVGDNVSGNQTLPTNIGQFGGFELGQSRNTNSTGYGNVVPKSEGWRVWSVDSNTGLVQLISAGHPETYLHGNGSTGANINIVKKRDCSMYENELAQSESAHILTGQEAVEWYNNQFSPNPRYTLVENGGSNSTFYNVKFDPREISSVLGIDSYYWLASAYDSKGIYFVMSGNYVYHGNGMGAFGVRILLSLKTDVLVERNTGNGSKESPWKLINNNN